MLPALSLTPSSSSVPGPLTRRAWAPGNPFGADAYTTEEESGKGELADRFVNMLRTSSGGTNQSPVSVLTEPRALDHSSLAPYARPAVSGQGRDSETSSDKSS